MTHLLEIIEIPGFSWSCIHIDSFSITVLSVLEIFIHYFM